MIKNLWLNLWLIYEKFMINLWWSIYDLWKIYDQFMSVNCLIYIILQWTRTFCDNYLILVKLIFGDELNFLFDEWKAKLELSEHSSCFQHLRENLTFQSFCQ